MVLSLFFQGGSRFLLSAHRCLDSRRITGFGQVLETTKGLHHFSDECLLLHIAGEEAVQIVLKLIHHLL